MKSNHFSQRLNWPNRQELLNLHQFNSEMLDVPRMVVSEQGIKHLQPGNSEMGNKKKMRLCIAGHCWAGKIPNPHTKLLPWSAGMHIRYSNLISEHNSVKIRSAQNKKAHSSRTGLESIRFSVRCEQQAVVRAVGPVAE